MDRDYDAHPELEPDFDGNDVSEFDDDFVPDEPVDMTDVEADADTLASAGFGTDEDYGYFGEAGFYEE